MTKKLLSLVVAALMVLALVPLGAAADDTVTVTLTAGDVWEDGSGYQMLLDADATAYGTIIPESGPLTSSGDASAATYAEFEYKIPTNADGSLSTSNIVINNSVTITIPAGTYDWCIPNPTPGDRMWIASEKGTAGGGRADDFVFEAGHSYEFTVSLGSDGHDRVDLAVDGVPVEEPHHPLPDGCLKGFYFENDYEQDDIYLLDLDGDDNAWGITDWDSAYEGSGVAYSASYSGGVLYPDNWLILDFGTVPSSGLTVTFWARGYSSYWYDEHFAAYVLDWDVDLDDENFPNNLPALTPVLNETVATANWKMYTCDLSAYAGKDIAFMIRHFNCSDVYYLMLDQVEFWGEEDVVEPTYYTVTFMDGLTNQVIATQQVEEGAAATAPAAPEHEGYNFIGWDTDFSNVTGNITVTALYEEIEVPPTGLPGDVDCNGVVDMSDVSLLFNYLNGGNAEITDQGMINANVNGDAGVSVMDITGIMSIVANS